MLTGVEADVSKIFGVGEGVLKRGTGAESEAEKCDSAHLCNRDERTVKFFSWSPVLIR